MRISEFVNRYRNDFPRLRPTGNHNSGYKGIRRTWKRTNKGENYGRVNNEV